MLSIASDFPSRLKFYRQALGLTRDMLAQQCGVSSKTLQAWEHGRSSPNVERLLRLALVFGITSCHLTGEVGAFAPGPETTKETPHAQRTA